MDALKECKDRYDALDALYSSDRLTLLYNIDLMTLPGDVRIGCILCLIQLSPFPSRCHAVHFIKKLKRLIPYVLDDEKALIEACIGIIRFTN